MKRGFTLIETVIVVGMIGMVLIAAVEIMLNSTKAKNRADLTVRLDQIGSSTLNEIRRNLINAIGGDMNCFEPAGVGSSALIYANIKDGQRTFLSCTEDGRVASESANYTIDMTPDEVELRNCREFVNCSTLPSGAISSVNVGFTLFSQGIGVSLERSFQSRVTIRN